MKTKVQPLLFIAALLLFSGQLQASPDAAAKIQFDLEAQTLPDAVTAWAEQSGLQLIWPKGSPALASLLRPKVSGMLSPDEALSQLLAGTGLTYSFIDEQTVLIRPIAAVVSSKDVNDVVSEVVVTGTNIRGVAPAGSPVIVLNQDDILRSGYTTTEQIVQSLAQTIRSGANGESADARFSAGSGASGNISYGSSVNLRGLGSTATLTLVNGHRIAASGQGLITDISLIPVTTIERIEVLADGASAVYGADAIAGVVNIILKDDFDGASTRIRYGFTEPSGRDEWRTSQTFGAKWQGGSVLAMVSYLDQTQLGANERPFTSNVAQPASIFPSSEQVGALLSGNHEIADSLTLRADAQYGRAKRLALGSATQGYFEFPADVNRTNTFMSLHYDGIEDWDFGLNGQFSRENTNFSFLHFAPGSSQPSLDRSQVQNLVQNQWTTGVSANGTLGATLAGQVELAVGVEHREEQYTHGLLSPTLLEKRAERTVDSAYVEFHVPILGEANAIPYARQMSLSLAGRYDNYSDFGDIINPKFGFSWTPMTGLEVRSTYSKSFRAPATGAELMSTARGTSSLVSIYSFRTADGTSTIPVAFLTGSRNLRPERARNWTAGLTIRPTNVKGMQVDVTYYYISCSDRIVGPPLDQDALSNPILQSFIANHGSPAQLHDALAREALDNLVYVDRTGSNFAGGAFGPNPQNLTTYVFDARSLNAGVVKTDGFDLGVKYSTKWQAGVVGLAVHANYINKIETAFVPGAPAFDSVGTTGNPAGLRLRASAAFSRGRWDAALATNFTGGYTDTAASLDMPVRSYTTVDANLTYTFLNSRMSSLENVSINVSVTNLFNERPPHISGSLATRGAEYDAANADALGRLAAIEFAKRW